VPAWALAAASVVQAAAMIMNSKRIGAKVQ
jgi:hypothetical protein